MMNPSDVYGEKSLFELAYGYPLPPDSAPVPIPPKGPSRAVTRGHTPSRTPAARDGSSRGHAAVVSRRVLPSGCVVLGVDFSRGRHGHRDGGPR